MRSGRVKGAEEKAAKLTAYRRNVRVNYNAVAATQPGTQQPSLFDFRRNVVQEALIVRIGE